MIDPKVLRQELDLVKQTIEKRGMKFDFEALLALEEKRRGIQGTTQELQNQRNALSKSIGQKKSQGEDVTDILAQVNDFKTQLDTDKKQLDQILSEQHALQSTLPNLLDESVPEGLSEEDNVEIRRWGEPREFMFTPKDHVDLTERLGQIDFNVAATMSGSRFVVMRGQIAKLHRALAQFMLDVHTTEHNYLEVNVPLLVEQQALWNSGQLPKFEEDLFHLKGERKLSLIPTAEVPVTNLFYDVILESNELPLKMVCHSPCFRSEAGSYGKDTKGMIRQHQFEKVELIQVVHPKNSSRALEELTSHAETILQRLELPYRVMNLCSSDVGFCATKTYDLEVWLPSQKCYREISSCSSTGSFQARRLQARFRPDVHSKPEYVHLLNGSGLAVGRTLLAVIENYQDESGAVHIPQVLLPYMNGLKVIEL
tara:strand:+ start:23788 stop:25065 length:1278 start_codon:yes stop_codon:yes gene_type:complete